MCLIVFAYHVKPGFSLVLGANRDEHYERPTAQASCWRPQRGFYTAGGGSGKEEGRRIVAGKDLQAGGTWLAVAEKGPFRFAAVTNYREAATEIGDKRRSRGELVSEFLVSDADAADFLAQIKQYASRYEGFNLLVGDSSGLWYFSNRDGVNTPRKLEPGRVYCLCNRLLDDPWPKVQRAKRNMSALMDEIHNYSVEETKERIFGMLKDSAKPPEDQLPKDTGHSVENEKLFSSVFIGSDWYGTRASTVLIIPDAKQQTEKAKSVLGHFAERSFGIHGIPSGEMNETFHTEPAPS